MGDADCPIIVSTSSLLVCVLPAGEGSPQLSVKSNPSSRQLMFSYDSPMITALFSVPPGGYATAGGQAVVLQVSVLVNELGIMIGLRRLVICIIA